MNSKDATLTFKKYQCCIKAVYGMFKKYERYTHCFAITRVDHQMDVVFQKIALAYVKIMRMVINLDPHTEKSAMLSFVNYANKTFFLRYVISVMDNHEEKMLMAFEHKEEITVRQHLHDLEYHANCAANLITLMKNMLRCGQTVSPVNYRVSA